MKLDGLQTCPPYKAGLLPSHFVRGRFIPPLEALVPRRETCSGWPEPTVWTATRWLLLPRMAAGMPVLPWERGVRTLPSAKLYNCTNFRASIPLWSPCIPAWNQPTGSKLLKRGWQTSRWTARQNSCVSFVSLGKQAKKRNKMQYSLIIVYKNTEISYLTLCNECNGSAELFILLEKPVSRPQRISWEAERQHNLSVTLSEKKLV